MPAVHLSKRIIRWIRVGVIFVVVPVVVGVLPIVRPVFGESASMPPAVSPERLQRGRVLYSKHCASCHGPSGAGDGAAGHDLDPQPTDLRDPEVTGKADVKLFRQITRGKAPMPSFGRLMNDDERWTVAAYVKTLGKAK